MEVEAGFTSSRACWHYEWGLVGTGVFSLLWSKYCSSASGLVVGAVMSCWSRKV